MNPSSPLFRGSCAALITPFTKDNKIDEVALRRLCGMQIEAHAGAILLCGTTGEGSSLSPSERREVISIALEVRQERNTRLPLIVGTGTSSTERTAQQSREAAMAGADALLITTPPYVKATREGLCAHLRQAAEASGLPILLYHVPARTGMMVSLPMLEDIARDCPEVVGIKEASGDLGMISRIKEAFGERFALYCGSDELNLPALALGADGLISVLAVPCPKITADLCRLIDTGSLPEARALHYAAMPLIRALFAQVNPVPVKGLMAILGYSTDRIRLPLTGASPTVTEAARTALVHLEQTLP